MAEDNKKGGWGGSPNGPKGLGKPGKGKSGYGQNQGSSRYNRKRITKNYGGGK